MRNKKYKRSIITTEKIKRKIFNLFKTNSSFKKKEDYIREKTSDLGFYPMDNDHKGLM